MTAMTDQPVDRGPRKQSYGVQVLDRIVAILNCFSNHTSERSFAELLQAVGLNKSTLYRLLEAMRSHDLIALDPPTGKYCLGMKLFELGMVSIGRLDVARVALPELETLVARVGETAHLCILDGSDVVYIAKVESKLSFRVPSNIGRRNPAYCTGVGKALLAHLPEQKLEEYLAQTEFRRFTRNTLTSPLALKRHFQQIRSQGYSVDDQEIEEGLRCIGAPVRDHTGEAIAAISVAGPATRMLKRNVRKLSSHVVAAADRISHRLGYVDREQDADTERNDRRGEKCRGKNEIGRND
jgi:DNA-binding IclR family transcriptional regulator